MSRELVHATRGSLSESIFRGTVAVVNNQGEILFEVGNPKEKVTFIRSAAKPIQALPVVASGAVDHFGIDESEFAIFCASHQGEEIHTKTVLSILQKIGLSESSLLCGTHPPNNRAAADELVRRGIKPSAVHNNCSGKHSGMLTLAQYQGHSLEDYYAINHPVQQQMLQAMADVIGVKKDKIILANDGCGVPVYGLSVYDMARAWAAFSNPEYLPPQYQEAAKRIAHAMYSYPMLISGTGGFCTALLEAGKGQWVNKGGAQAVYCIGIRDKNIGIALKIESGHSQAAAVTAIEVMKRMNLLTAEQEAALEKFHKPKILNAKEEIVGEMIPVF